MEKVFTRLMADLSPKVEGGVQFALSLPKYMFILKNTGRKRAGVAFMKTDSLRGRKCGGGVSGETEVMREDDAKRRGSIH